MIKHKFIGKKWCELSAYVRSELLNGASIMNLYGQQAYDVRRRQVVIFFESLEMAVIGSIICSSENKQEVAIYIADDAVLCKAC